MWTDTDEALPICLRGGCPDGSARQLASHIGRQAALLDAVQRLADQHVGFELAEDEHDDGHAHDLPADAPGQENSHCHRCEKPPWKEPFAKAWRR